MRTTCPATSDTNWTLRLASNYGETYPARLRANRALNLPWALALALRARGRAFVACHRGLLAGLDALAARLSPVVVSDRLKPPFLVTV